MINLRFSCERLEPVLDGEYKKDSRKRRNTSGHKEAKGKAEDWDLEILNLKTIQ